MEPKITRSLRELETGDAFWHNESCYYVVNISDDFGSMTVLNIVLNIEKVFWISDLQVTLCTEEDLKEIDTIKLKGHLIDSYKKLTSE